MGHEARILDQFTRQAVPFARKPALSDDGVTARLLRAARVTPADRVLDVACGPGLMACAFARVAAAVTGIDLTPAMIEQARGRQAALGLTNLEWRVGDAAALPFADAAFDLTFSRYALHHVIDPARVVGEMARVTRPGGRVVVVDVAPPKGKAARYDWAERLRDPSHVRAVPREDYEALAAAAGLVDVRSDFYRLGMRLEDQLAASFPEPGAADVLREAYRADLGRDELGLGVCLKDGDLWFSFPTAVCVGHKTAEPGAAPDPARVRVSGSS